MDLIKAQLIQFIANNLSLIIFGVCGFAYSYLEYRLGEGDHGSFIGFLKKYFAKKNEPQG